MMDREYHRNYSREYYHKRMNEIKSSLGGKCVECGSSENLELHHTDPCSKKFSITSKILSIKKSEVKEELEKCVLLCHDCHKKISNRQLAYSMKHSSKKLVNVRPVKCVEDDLQFDSITECAKHYGVHVVSIQRVCSGDRKSWHNKHFEYAGEKRTLLMDRYDQ